MFSTNRTTPNRSQGQLSDVIKTLSSPTWQYKGLKLPLLSLLVLLFPLFFLGLQVQNQLNNQIWSIATSEFFNFLKTAGIYACIFSAKFWLHVSLSLQMAQPVWKQTAATISLRRQWRDSSASLCYSDKGNKDWIWTFVYDGKSSSDGRNITAHGSNTEYTEDILAKRTIQGYCHFLQSLRNMNNGAPAVAGSRYHSSPVTWISCRHAHFKHRMEKTVAEALVFLLAYKFGILGSLRIQEAGLTIKPHRLHAPMTI